MQCCTRETGVANIEESSHVPSRLDVIDATSKVFVEPRIDDSHPVNSGPVDSHLGVSILVDPCHILEPKILMQNESSSRVKEFVPECEPHLSDKCDTRDVCFGGRDVQQYSQKLLDHFPDDQNRSKRTKIWFLKILGHYSDFDTLEPVIVWNLKNFGLIFTCLSMKASQVEVVEVATSFDVSSFMYASRFFVVCHSALMPLFNLVAPEKENKFFDCFENEFFEYLCKEHFES